MKPGLGTEEGVLHGPKPTEMCSNGVEYSGIDAEVVEVVHRHSF